MLLVHFLYMLCFFGLTNSHSFVSFESHTWTYIRRLFGFVLFVMTLHVQVVHCVIDLQMTPRCLLVGHTAPVLCLSKASIVLDNNFIVSSSESG